MDSQNSSSYVHYWRCTSNESDVAGPNPNRVLDNDAEDDELEDDSYLDPSYTEDTENDFYLHGQRTRPGQTNYG